MKNAIDTNVTVPLSEVDGLGGAPEAVDAKERALLKRIANNDHMAMHRFVLLYETRLTHFLRRFTRRHELVEEIVNDTMFFVWKGANNFRFESRVSTWVIGVAYRRAMCTFRGESRRRIGGAHLAEGDEWPSDEVQDRLETSEWLESELVKLPLEQKTALELMYHVGYSCKEVAKIMGCPTGTVKTRIFHARRKLRFALPVAAGLRPATIRPRAAARSMRILAGSCDSRRAVTCSRPGRR